MKATQAPETEVQDKNSHLDLVEGPSGPLLVHRVPSAPPRPILCADDPEATLLKAVQLLLAYPKCNALPVVSPVRLTVMAYLTLSACLAFILSRLRGEQLLPLAQLKVGQEVQVGTCADQQKFEFAKYAELSAQAEGDNLSWVLSESQPLRELLHFFAKTHHSSIPVVEDSKGSLVYNLSRRDLLSYLDLAMQSARCHPQGHEDRIVFDLSAPIEVVVKALKRYKVDDSRLRAVEVATSMLQEQSLLDGLLAEVPQDPKGQTDMPGATISYDKDMSMKDLILCLLEADNRKVFLVEDCGDKMPKLQQIISAGDIWRMLIGPEKDEKANADSISV